MATVRAHERRSVWICNVALVITFGIILLIVGFLIHSPVLWAIGGRERLNGDPAWSSPVVTGKLYVTMDR